MGMTESFVKFIANLAENISASTEERAKKVILKGNLFSSATVRPRQQTMLIMQGDSVSSKRHPIVRKMQDSMKTYFVSTMGGVEISHRKAVTVTTHFLDSHASLSAKEQPQTAPTTYRLQCPLIPSTLRNATSIVKMGVFAVTGKRTLEYWGISRKMSHISTRPILMTTNTVFVRMVSWACIVKKQLSYAAKVSTYVFMEVVASNTATNIIAIAPTRPARSHKRVYSLVQVASTQ
jgi:hypothetical protein